MARSPKGGSSGKSGSSKGSSMFAGILLGMMFGLIAAGVIAWYVLKKNPASFEDKARNEAPKAEVKNAPLPPAAAPVVTPVVVAPIVASAPAVAPAATEPKQHFTFYKELTDKQDGAARKAPEKHAATPKEAHPAPQAAKPAPTAASSKDKFFVQAGSFTNEGDAEKLKAKLALLGMEASLQKADIPNKGTYHRVRLGPFNGSDETNKTLALLKQNGVANATSFKAQ